MSMSYLIYYMPYIVYAVYKDTIYNNIIYFNEAQPNNIYYLR